uniref:PPFIA binding protein 2 n=1 Tax=Cyprinus carpio carpio TaxID=630221 RepID=A0A8C1BSA4_CYPCA
MKHECPHKCDYNLKQLTLREYLGHCAEKQPFQVIKLQIEVHVQSRRLLCVKTHCSSNNETYQDRLARLEGDKESLVLQVSVLTDQVEAQGEKIRDLESSLEEHHHKLISTEEMLQQELVSRTSLETQKLELMDEVSYLKLKLVGMEEEQNHMDEQQKHHKAESVVNLISELQEQMCKFQEEISNRIQEQRALESLGDSGTREALDQSPDVGLGASDALLQELRLLKSKVEELEGEKSQYERKLKATKVMYIYSGTLLDFSLVIFLFDLSVPDQELQRLKTGMETLIAANNQKDRHIEELNLLLGQYRKLKDGLALSQVDYFLFTGKAEKTDDSTLSDLSPISSGVESGQQSPVSPEHKKNQKGIRKLWGKIRRTQSGSLPADSSDSDFKRGGFRATAGPRLASARDTNAPFSKWSCDQVCAWMEEFGLGQYVNMARQWVTSGQTLLSASSQDFEKELGIKHPLHRKKLQLALHSFSTKITEKSSELDHIWVTRWLDDIGLPQYKDQFSEGRVDGRMLQYLTVNDLLFLKVTSQLHHLSIKCAIHVLHVNKFNPNCLKRRPGDENKMSPSEVVQWSNHRVMEWLRSVDLAEYAPNLRGSGVHGGLIILEPRFNSDTLAMLLNIPPQKTLLRRHLATNFNTLVGSQAQQEKQEYLESSGYTPLTTTAKVRPRKIGFSSFGHRKKRSDDSTDYICPLDASQAQALLNGASRPYSGFRGMSPIFDRDPEKRVQVGCMLGKDFHALVQVLSNKHSSQY